MLARHADSIIALDTPLRGGRDYVHSTDLFEALEGAAKTFAPGTYLQSLVLRRPAHHQVEAHFLAHPDAFGTFALVSRRRTVPGWLVEGTQPITRRRTFDEAPISCAALVEPGHVFLRAPVRGYTAFEQMIVLFKILSAQSQIGAWLFTALELSRPLRDDATLSLTRTQTILHRLIAADLHQNGELAGRAQMVLRPDVAGPA